MATENHTVISALKLAEENLPDSFEKIVVLAMIGNIYAGVSNEPLSTKACSIARQILEDIT